MNGAAPDPGSFLQLLITLVAVILTGRLLGRLFSVLGQPPVIGEVIAGVALGPSLLGAVAPDIASLVLPNAAAPALSIVAQLGVVLYMFLVGIELNPDRVRHQLRATVAISQTSIVVPFVLGWALALYLYPRYATPDVPFVSFSLFLGIAMSITAFPVLARILADLGMTQTPLGVVALTCAAIDDVTAWCLLALVVGVVQASTGGALLTIVLTVAFIGAMFAVVRPLVAKVVRGAGVHEPTRGGIALALVAMLVTALVTEAIGVHAIFGAFLFGAVIPHDSRLARALTGSLENIVTILLLPAFFAFAGLRTEIGLLTGVGAWLACGLIIVVATVGKVGGTFVAARLAGMRTRDAAGLGVLMNTRGLMQLIVLNVGLELGVIGPTLFTMMVVMAIATTMATTPILRTLMPVPFAAAIQGRPEAHRT
jgi:Kef-type K+ transport system membrane component KefB